MGWGINLAVCVRTRYTVWNYLDGDPMIKV